MKKKPIVLGILLILALFIVPSVQVMAGTSKVSSVAVSAQDPNPVSPGTAATYSITVTRVDPKSSSTSGTFDTTLTIVNSNLPSGALIVFKPQMISFVNTETVKTSTLSITVSSSGTYIFTVKATRNDAPNDFQFMPCTLTVARTYYTITASAGNGGSISPQGTVTVEAGSSPVFSISASPGYHILDVLVDGASVGALASYTFSNVQGDHTITASFKINMDLTLPPGVTCYVSTTSNLPKGILQPISSDREINGDVYFNVIVTSGTLSGTIIVTIQYDPTGLTLEQQQNLRLYMGDPVDFNGDLTVNGQDITLMQNAIQSFQSGTLSLADKGKFDVNQDGQVNGIDLDIVQQYASSGLLVPSSNGGQWRLPWIDITTEVNTTLYTISGETSHFSGFGVH